MAKKSTEPRGDGDRRFSQVSKWPAWKLGDYSGLKSIDNSVKTKSHKDGSAGKDTRKK
jgi:hypothetical protein